MIILILISTIRCTSESISRIRCKSSIRCISISSIRARSKSKSRSRIRLRSFLCT